MACPQIAALAVYFAKHMVQQNIGGTGGVRTRKVADNGIKAKGGLDWRRLKPEVQHIAGAFGKQVQHIAPGRHVEFFELSGRLDCRQEIPEIPPNVGRRLQRQLAQHIRHPLKHGVVGRQTGGISL